MDIIKTFFRLPQEELLKIHVDNSQGVKGYLPFSFRDGRRCRASYSFGRDYTNPEQHFVKKAPEGTVTVNQWPEDALPAFRTVLYEYYQEVFVFARQMLHIFALALGLDETDLDDSFRFPLNDITMQYYPVQDPNDGSSIVPHADYGGFTLLHQGTFIFLALLVLTPRLPPPSPSPPSPLSFLGHLRHLLTTQQTMSAVLKSSTPTASGSPRPPARTPTSSTPAATWRSSPTAASPLPSTAPLATRASSASPCPSSTTRTRTP